jgi:hypothetical protein
MTFMLERPPRDEDELWWVIKALWGVELPRVAVCSEHVSPFHAVAQAYFARDNNFAVWYASRGSGKSLALAVLGLTKAFVRDIDVTILGGSMTQSLNVREHMRKLMRHRNAPLYAVEKDQATLIQMATGKEIKPLPASQTTVRGPHPPMTLLDEVDEMEKAIYDAALGQAMEQENIHGERIEEYIVASSTWQNPEGTFTDVMEDARDKVELYFQRPEVYGEPLEVLHKGNGDHDEYLWANYDPAGVYAVGADWAKERDKTVIAVIRYDTTPRTMVKLIRINRRPWPEMIELFNKTKVAYRAVGEHDKTGLGSVVNDYLIESDTVRGFVMVGRPRTKLLLDYITSFEHGEYRLPVIPIDLNHQGVTVNPLYRAHRSTTVADVYAPGKWDSHLPDDFAAMALAHRAAERIPQPTTEDSLVPLDLGAREVDKVFATQSVESVTLIGDVQVVDERYPGGVSEFVISGDGGRDIWEAMEL